MNKIFFSLAGFLFSLDFDDKHLAKEFKQKYQDFLAKSNKIELLKIKIVIDNSCNYCIPEKNGQLLILRVPKNKKSLSETILEINWRLKTAIISELSKHGFILLHASCFISGNLAYVFCGNSGAGKSTISQIAQDNNLLKSCDDSVLVNFNDGNLVVYSNPFIEKEKNFYQKNQWKLKSIFFLNQAKIDKKEILNKLSTIKQIIANSYLADYETGIFMSPTTFDLAEKIANKTDCYDLFFTKTNKFLKIVLSE